MKRKIISAVLVVCMLATCFVTANFSVTAADTAKTEAAATPNEYSGITSNPYGLAQSNDDATILQAWNWSYANLENELEKIAEQGFTTVQISPPNEIKEGTTGVHVFESSGNTGWWMFYQPAGFQINESTDNALGTKAQLISMVKKAHSLGIKVIADTVINHMGTAGKYLDSNGKEDVSKTDPKDHVTEKAAQFEKVIYDNDLFHNPYFNMTYKEDPNQYSQYDSTYDLTRGCTSYLPDLKTEDSRVQAAIYEYLQELVDCGIDGFRVDAAKHIETPNDLSSLASNFLPNTLGAISTYAKNNYGKDLLTYGEILNNCGVNRQYSWYYPYMKVTDTSVYYSITGNISNGNAAAAIPADMANGTKAQTVLWNESHDNYADGNRPTDTELTKRWALMASRDGITSMFLARPASDSQLLGVASETLWAKSAAVKAVNNFRNYYTGQGEYLSYGSSVAVIGRGSKTSGGGAVLVNCSGTSKSVSGLSVPTLADGTYKDKVTGGTFTVSGGKASGSIGSTGVAVLYVDGPIVSASTDGTYNTATKTISFTTKNVASATYKVNDGDETPFASGDTLVLGTDADVAGATYIVTLKGFDSTGTQVTTAEYRYTKVEKETTYNITLDLNGVSGWSAPKMYAWNSATEKTLSAWPGTAMQSSGGKYTATLDASYDRIIFTSGTKQTLDLTINQSTNYTLQSSTSTNAGGTTCNNVKAESAISVTPYYPSLKPWVFESDYDYGDVNRDNVININDVTIIQQKLARIIKFDTEQLNLADFNKDGRLSIQDATAIQYYLLTNHS